MGKLERSMLVLLMISGLAIGILFRMSLTDKTQGNRLDGFFVAEFPDVENTLVKGKKAQEFFEEYAKSIQEVLDEAEFLITCVPTGEIKYDVGCVTTTVKVTSVLKGAGIHVGDVIRVYRGGWGVHYNDDGDYVDLGFSTFLLGGYEYLLFLSNRMDVNERKFGLVYEIPDLTILPAFCLEEREKVTIKPYRNDDSTYVPLETLRDNEFLAASEATMDGMQEYKRRIIERYAPEIGVGKGDEE